MGDGGCAHFGGQVFKTGRLATGTSSAGRMELGEVVSEHDMSRAIQAALKSREKAQREGSNEPQPAAQQAPVRSRFDEAPPAAKSNGGSEGITLMSLMKKQRTE